MIFRWPSGRLDHWHLFNRKLLYRALGEQTLRWHGDSVIDRGTEKIQGQRRKGMQKARHDDRVEQKARHDNRVEQKARYEDE